jgi:nucleoside 2-deoxyribosyltransferase
MIVSSIRVYISTSWKGDLEDERKAVEDLIKSDLLMFPIYPRHASSRDVSSDYFKIMNSCDLVIVILGSCYSEHVNNEINYAFSNNIPVLCFTKDCEREEKLDEEISKLKDKRIITTPFKVVGDLEKEVKEAIINLLSEKFKDYIEIEKSILRLISDGRIETLKLQPLQSEYIGVPRINPFERR